MNPRFTLLSTGVRLIVGLGNPEKEYGDTRHNVGAWFLDTLSQYEHASLKLEKKFRGATAQFHFKSEIIFLLKPSTYMNESGLSVSAVARFYKLPPESILVVHDELDFEVGVIRLKQAGGHGGHNGLRDIIAQLGSTNFYRLRIGIGHPGSRAQVTNYVLSAPSIADRQKIMASFQKAEKVMPELLSGEFQKAFHQLHGE